MSRLIFVGVFLIVSISRVLAYPYYSQNEDFSVNARHPKYHEQVKIPYWIKVILTVILVLLGGLFAGLTLGLMSLDETNLHILASSGDATQRKYAARIKPIRKNGHMLLVTLLLVNVLVNETLPIIMDDVMGGGGITAILVSSVLIVIFGEIIPQAVCSRYGLAIGAFFAWPVRILMWLTYIIAYPIAKLLDKVLGENHGIIYRRAELKELIQYHGSSTKHGGDLVTDSVTIIRGALDLQDKAVEIAMTPIDKVYMLPVDTIMDRITMREIYSTGHSRIPIYGESRQNIVGVLLTKSLIMYSPDEARPLKNFPINNMPTVLAATPLFDILNTFQDGRSHMAIVVKGEENMPIGVITLEDVLEELIQEEIYDESDTRIGLAVKLETGDQLILASKKKRAESSKVVYHKHKFKSPSSRADSIQGTPSQSVIENNRAGDLIVFDEPSTMSTIPSRDDTGELPHANDSLTTNAN